MTEQSRYLGSSFSVIPISAQEFDLLVRPGKTVEGRSNRMVHYASLPLIKDARLNQRDHIEFGEDSSDMDLSSVVIRNNPPKIITPVCLDCDKPRR